MCINKKGSRTREFLCGDGVTLYLEWCQLHKFIHGIKCTELYTQMHVKNTDKRIRSVSLVNILYQCQLPGFDIVLHYIRCHHWIKFEEEYTRLLSLFLQLPMSLRFQNKKGLVFFLSNTIQQTLSMSSKLFCNEMLVIKKLYSTMLYKTFFFPSILISLAYPL